MAIAATGKESLDLSNVCHISFFFGGLDDDTTAGLFRFHFGCVWTALRHYGSGSGGNNFIYMLLVTCMCCLQYGTTAAELVVRRV